MNYDNAHILYMLQDSMLQFVYNNVGTLEIIQRTKRNAYSKISICVQFPLHSENSNRRLFLISDIILLKPVYSRNVSMHLTCS